MSDPKGPVHPGQVLAGELARIGVSGTALAIRLSVPDTRIYDILKKKRNITADTALRLGKFFGNGADFWLNLQKSYELGVAQQQIGQSLETIIPYQNAGKPVPAGR